MIALRQANEVRSRRAKLKQHLRQGRVRLEEVLAAPGDYLATTEVFDLLVAAPQIGPVKAARLLTMARVSRSMREASFWPSTTTAWAASG